MRPKKLGVSDIAARLAEELSLPLGTVEPFVKRFIAALRRLITKELQVGGELKLKGLGVFYLRSAKSARRRHINTKELMVIDLGGQLKFRVSHSLRNELRERHRKTSNAG